MGEWKCEQSAVTAASRAVAWSYWTDMDNHALLEPGVERIEVDGPFATGTAGRTITGDHRQEWTLTDVVEGQRFGILGYTPDGRGTLCFWWGFEDEGGGTRITYRIRAEGPDVAAHMDVFRQLESSAAEGVREVARRARLHCPGLPVRCREVER